MRVHMDGLGQASVQPSGSREWAAWWPGMATSNSHGAKTRLPRSDRAFGGPVFTAVCLAAMGIGAASGQTFVGLGSAPDGGTDSSAAAISADGSVVVGSGSYSGVPVAFRWANSGGMLSLGTIPGGTYSVGNAVNANGSVVVGESDVGVGERA